MNKLMPVLLMLALILYPVPRAALAQQQLTDASVVKIKADIARRLRDEKTNVTVSKRADTCRQLLRRARQHLADARARFEVSPEQLQKLARQFALTCGSGDLKGLVTALA